MKIDINKAKASWDAAGLNDQGKAAIYAWIEKLADNIEAGHGRWDAYASNAYYTGTDKMGSVGLLKAAAEQTSK
jgi:hypothetical protein